MQTETTIQLALAALLLCACAGEPFDGKGGSDKAGEGACQYNFEDPEGNPTDCPERYKGTGDGCDCGCLWGDVTFDPDCGMAKDTGPTEVRLDMYERNWLDMTETEFLTAAVRPPFPHAHAVQEGEAEYAIVQRLQPWVDAAFAQVRQQHQEAHPDEAFIIPTPRVRVVPAKSPNGWVGGVGVCLTAPTRIDVGEAGREARTTNQMILFGDHLSDLMPGRPFGTPREPCVNSAASEDLTAYVEFFNSLGGPCQLAEAEGGLVIEGAECRYLGTSTHVDEVVVLTTSPFLNLTSEMIVVSEQEEMVVSTLLHELGHYVLAHPLNAAVNSRYNHWYQQFPEPSTDHSPTEDSSTLSSRLDTLYPIPRLAIPGQHYGPRMTRFVVSSLGNQLLPVCAEGVCVCQEAVDLLSSTWTPEVACLGCSYVTADVETAYLAYESALRACAEGVVVSDEVGGLSLTAMLTKLRERGLDEFIPAEAEYEDDQSLSWWLEQLRTSTGAADTVIANLLSDIEDRHLGRYTAEQHADDFSVQIWSAIGLEPQGRVEVAHLMAKVRHDSDPHSFERRNGFTFAWFDHLYERSWLDDDGYVFIPLGEVHDIHHGMPYRVFNMSRENQAHGYETSGTLPTLPDTHTWEQIMELAVGLRVRVPPPRNLTPVPRDPDDPTVVDGDPPFIID